MDTRNIVIWALVALAALFSVISVALCALDKSRAKRGGRRVPEATLMLFAALGGSVFMFLTMLIIRHKTRHAKFMLGIPAIIVYQAAIVYLILT